jgi:S1-C subfamily serine protease
MLLMKIKNYLLICVGFAILLRVGFVSASGDAVGVYAKYQRSVFQVKIIELESDSRSSLGTGFVVGDGTLLATNYHVIATKLFDPDKYRIEIEREGDVFELQIVAANVVNDLALLKVVAAVNAEPESIRSGEDASLIVEEPFVIGEAFKLQAALPSKGETLYALGNPHDIGMTVVEGNFNGLVEHRFTRQIHFSGAINPGMSGGPVVDKKAGVVGINVATSGNQIGFLVPSSALADLLESFTRDHQPGLSIIEGIGLQIADHTTAMIDSALADPWEQLQLGDVAILSSRLPWLECWGDSDRDKKRKIFTISRGCHSGSNTYLSHRFNTAIMEYEFMYFEAPEWPSYSVYQYLANETNSAVPGNRGPKEQLSEFNCQDQQLSNKHGLRSRVSYCVRAYKKFRGIYDVFYLSVSVDQTHKAVMSHYTLSGVTESAAQRFLEHFIGVVSWSSL